VIWCIYQKHLGYSTPSKCCITRFFQEATQQSAPKPLTATLKRWALDWTWIGLDLDYDEFCWFWIGSGLWNTSQI